MELPALSWEEAAAGNLVGVVADSTGPLPGLNERNLMWELDSQVAQQ